MKAPRSHKIMTFTELMANPHRASRVGTCRFCKGYMVEGWHYAVRHFVCRDCAERRASEVMPSVIKGQRKAREWAREHGSAGASLIAHVSGVSAEYAEWAIKHSGGRA